MVGERTTYGVHDRVVVESHQRILRVASRTGIAVRAVVDLIAAVVPIAEEQADFFAEALIDAAKLVPEVVLTDVRAGDEVVEAAPGAPVFGSG